MKKYYLSSIVYALLALVGGVFYREFTKGFSFTGQTTLSVVHVHYFVLGTILFLVMLLLEKSFSFTNKKINIAFILYHVGLNLTCIMFLVRGILQVTNQPLTTGIDAMVSGFAGIGHIILGVSLVLVLVFIYQNVFKKKKIEEQLFK